MPAPAQSLQDRLGLRYRLGPEIGRGGTAIVYRAEDTATGSQAAIKVIRMELARVLGSERFHREIKIASYLVHPSIMPLIDWGEVDGLLYYVMPFLAGGSLRERIQQETQLTSEEAVRIAGGIADGLAYAHERGVVHRDIKPGNILLHEDQVIIADFGLAQVVNALDQEVLTTSGLALGTPTYMSPEQAACRTVDARTDIYSLGCVMYEMLAGEPPFRGATVQAVAARHLGEPPLSLSVVLPALSKELESIVIKALAKAPADRFQTADDLKASLAMARIVPR